MAAPIATGVPRPNYATTLAPALAAVAARVTRAHGRSYRRPDESSRRAARAEGAVDPARHVQLAADLGNDLGRVEVVAEPGDPLAVAGELDPSRAGSGSTPCANRGSIPTQRLPSAGAGAAMRVLPNNMPVSTVPRALAAP
jgi:hypothetical protein